MTPKVPPVLLTAFISGLMWWVARVTPRIEMPVLPQRIATSALAVCGFFLIVQAVHAFRRSRTSLNPLKPASASTLTTTGVYRFTRNPMYLGLLLLLLAWAVCLSSPYSVALCGAFVLWIHHFQIAPEEKALEARFGQSYISYKERVRRWL